MARYNVPSTSKSKLPCSPFVETLAHPSGRERAARCREQAIQRFIAAAAARACKRIGSRFDSVLLLNAAAENAGNRPQQWLAPQLP